MVPKVHCAAEAAVECEPVNVVSGQRMHCASTGQTETERYSITRKSSVSYEPLRTVSIAPSIVALFRVRAKRLLKRFLCTREDFPERWAAMSGVPLVPAADQISHDWDVGLSQMTTGVIHARLRLYSGGASSEFLQALRDLRRYIVRSASQRAASPTLEDFLAMVLSPVLQEFYAEENTYSVVAELLNIVGTHAVHLHFWPVCTVPESVPNR